MWEQRGDAAALLRGYDDTGCGARPVEPPSLPSVPYNYTTILLPSYTSYS